MVEDHKKSESNDESEETVQVMHFKTFLETIRGLEKRVLALEKAMIDVKHTNTDDGSRHRNDGGWFD